MRRRQAGGWRVKVLAGGQLLAKGHPKAKLLCSGHDQISLFAGVQQEYFGTFTRNAGNKQAPPDTSGGLDVLFGVEVDF
jgi:hypothetical protein